MADRGATGAYLALLRGQARAQAAYRTSFAIDLVSNVGATAFDVLTVLVLFGVTRQLGGFEIRAAMVVVGLSACAFAAANLAVGNMSQLRTYVRTGLLDAVLVRPVAALPQLVLMDVPLRKASRAVFGVTVLAVALAAAGIDWTPGRILLACLTPVAGAVFFGSIFVATASVAFWWIESGEVGNAFTYGGRDLTSYPITVYSGWFRQVFAYGLGFAFVAYYPGLALLGRPDPLGLPTWVGWVAPAVALPAAAVATVVWRMGIRHYRSTGS
ncbi:MAG TPA: ABC-2 family transporter protein [Micromonosporaceae bacterium]